MNTQARELLSGFVDHRLELNQLSWRQFLLVPGLDRLLKPVLPPANRSILARKMGWNLYATATKPE